MEAFEVDVVVVGAGAAGLSAATTLGRYGVSTLLVEQRREPSTAPRATGISTRAMEVLRRWGLEDEVLAGGSDAEVWLWECPTLARAAEGSGHAVAYPSREQAAVVSPCAPAVVPQDWLEEVLRRHVQTLPSVRFEAGTQLVDLDNRPDGVTVTLAAATGAVRRVRTRYLLAADGAHSAVRTQLGIAMHSWEGSHHGVAVVFRAPLWHLLGDLRYALYVVSPPDAPGLFLPAGRGDRWIYGPGWLEDVEQEGIDLARDLPPGRLVEAIRQGAGVIDLDLRIEHVGAFEALGQLAERFRAGRTFLVGDAAHRVTPRGGTGMNTAFQSGHDLGWKLAWVLRGWADPALLDSYEAERRVVAEHNIARSTDPNGSRRPVLDELHVDLGGRITHAWLPSSEGRVSTLDLLGPGWTLFTGPASEAWIAAATTASAGAPLTMRTLDALTARHLGVRGDGALLARPDGVPAVAWPSPAGVAELRRAMAIGALAVTPDRAVA